MTKNNGQQNRLQGSNSVLKQPNALETECT